MFPTTNLQPGQRGPEVEKLQKFLLSQGLLTEAQIATGPGIYGPQTTSAVKKWQEMNGVDNTTGPGYWGPKTIAAASGTPTNNASSFLSQSSVDAANRAGEAASKITGIPYNPGTVESFSGGSQPYSDEEYAAALESNPIIQASVAKGNTVEDLAYAAETGDLSRLVNQFGQPFSLEDQQAALAKAEEDNKLYYEALQSKDIADAESALAQKKADYQDYLLNSGQQFESDKAQSDQSAADKGVLFSGGRVQREKNLARAYEQDQASKLGSISRDIGNTARDFQYKYGNDSVNALSESYKLGANTYNPNVATGGVKSSGLSSIYNPSQYNYQGTQNVARKTAANQRAAGYLWNKGNKLLATGAGNKY